VGERPAAEVDARADRRAPRARPHLERGDIPEAPEPRADVPPAANGSRARGAVLHPWIALVSARAQSTGTHDAVAAHEPGERGGALPGRVELWDQVDRALLPERRADLFVKHPRMGDLTVEEWMRFHVIHARHHARQLRERLGFRP